MRHRNSGRKLGRSSTHRKALFKNMASALLTYGRITTTEAKAKEIRGVVEPLITLAQQNTLHARREAYRVLGNHRLVKRLFDEIAPLFRDGKGGYTRVVKLAMPRKGDSAPMAIVELIRGSHLDKVVEEKGKSAKAAKAAETEAPVGEAAEKPKKAKAVKPKEEGDAKKAAPKPAPKPKAEKTTTKASKVTSNKPKSTPSKIGS